MRLGFQLLDQGKSKHRRWIEIKGERLRCCAFILKEVERKGAATLCWEKGEND